MQATDRSTYREDPDEKGGEYARTKSATYLIARWREKRNWKVDGDCGLVRAGF